MAIDASASMFVKLPDVQLAAEDFVESLAEGRDRAFLMGFGTEPQVITALTRDLERLDNGIGSLAASGETALWESIVASLEQLEGVAGRKALVVFYDGADEDDESFYRRSVELAEETGTPVYLIIMNDEAARTEGRDFRTRGFASRLNRLAAAGGGRVYFVRTGMNLAPVFQEIGEELRSHYLLTFYSERPFRGREWRHLEVDVKRKGLTTRTLSGFYSQAEDEIR
jgi:VWFA-related protein